MEEDLNSMLKCKVSKFVRKQPNLKKDEDTKKKHKLELEVEDLGASNSFGD